MAAGGEDGWVILPAERRHRVVVIVTLIAYLGIGLFPFAVSGLLVPTAAVVVLMFCWFGGLFLTVRLAMNRPLLAPVGVAGALVFWYAFVTLGSIVFGWTA